MGWRWVGLGVGVDMAGVGSTNNGVGVLFLHVVALCVAEVQTMCCRVDLSFLRRRHSGNASPQRQILNPNLKDQALTSNAKPERSLQP